MKWSGASTSSRFTRPSNIWKAKGLDLAPLLKMPDVGPEGCRGIACRSRIVASPDFDRKLIGQCAPAIERGEKVSL